MDHLPPSYDIVMIGNYTKDTILSPAGTSHVDGGGMNYAANAAVRLGLKTAVVTCLVREDERVLRALISSGIDCYPTYTPASTCLELRYPTANPDVRTLTMTSTAGSINAGAIQTLATRAAVISPSLRGEVGRDVIELLNHRGVLLAADMQGFARVLHEGKLVYEHWPEMRDMLALVDIVKSDAVEAEFLTGEKNIHKAAKAFSALGPREIVLTHKGGLLVYVTGEAAGKDGSQMYEMEFYPRQLDGRSGRGDTCIGAYTACRLTMDPYEAGIWAAALTSLKMETLGPFHCSVQDVEELIRRKYRQEAHKRHSKAKR